MIFGSAISGLSSAISCQRAPLPRCVLRELPERIAALDADGVLRDGRGHEVRLCMSRGSGGLQRPGRIGGSCRMGRRQCRVRRSCCRWSGHCRIRWRSCDCGSSCRDCRSRGCERRSCCFICGRAQRRGRRDGASARRGHCARHVCVRHHVWNGRRYRDCADCIRASR